MSDEEQGDEDVVRTTIRMPRNLRDEAKAQAEHGQLSEMVRDVFREIAFGEDINKREQYKRQLERIRDDKDDIRADIRDLQTELEKLEAQEARLEERLNETTSLRDKYDGMLEMLEHELYSGENIFAEHAAVKRAARTSNLEPDQVIEELKERNPEIPEYAFEPKMHADREWFGIDGYGGEEDD